MSESKNPEWLSLANVLFVILIIAFGAVLNTCIDHNNRPPEKRYKDRKNNAHLKTESHSEANPSTTKPQQEKKKQPVKAEEKIVDDPPKKSSAQKTVTPAADQSDEEYFAGLMKNYKEKVMAKLTPPESRQDMVVRYYTKAKDDDKIYGLRKYGFYIHERLPDESFADHPSNALYYGDDVSNEDIQLIAYVLVKSGVELKKIVPSKLHDNWKANAVEIGTDTMAFDSPVLKISDLRKNWKKK